MDLEILNIASNTENHKIIKNHTHHSKLKNPNLFRNTFLGKFSPVSGGFMTGDSSVYLYTGVEGQYGIGRLKILPSFTPGYYEKGNGKDLGSALEFKSEIKLGNKTLLEHTLNKIKSKLNKIIIVSNKDLVKNYTVINDCIEGQLGPLVGVLSAMKYIKKNNFSYNWVATFPCDTPFFDIYIIEEFFKVSKLNDSLLYFVKSKEKRHNIFGLWSLKLIETLEKDIIQNNYRKVEKWANKVGVKIINASYDGADPFFNINTQEDLIEAEKILKNQKHD